jgi:hypothetical protein
VFRQSKELGCKTIDYSFRFDDSDDSIARLRGLMDKYDIEPDMRALPSLFKLAEPGEEGGRIPFMTCATPFGEGMVDVRGAIEYMARKSKHAKGLHLIVEMGWMPQHNDKTPEERVEITKIMYDQYIEELLKFIDR